MKIICGSLVLYPETFEDDETLAKRHKAGFEQVEKELQEYLAFIKENPMGPMESNVDYDLLMESHNHWLNYRSAYLQAIFKNLKDDPKQALYFSEAKDITEERLMDLKIDFERTS